MKTTHPVARISLAIAICTFLAAMQNVFAEDAERLPATKHQAESLEGVTENETRAPEAEQDGMPVTPHQHDALEEAVNNVDGSLRLSGDQEVPAVNTSATGSSSIVIGANHFVSGSITTSGLASTAAHIHHAAKGANGPVIVTLTRTSDTVWTVPAGATVTDAHFKSYEAGDLYVNVHSEANKGGEIRAQLKP